METYAADFTIIAGHLYKLGADEVLQRYVLEHEIQAILVEAHGGIAGGHYAGKVMMQKILRARLWWPALHSDSHNYCKACDTCQRIGIPLHRDEMQLQPQMDLQAFEKLAIDFIGPINPPGKKTGACYIITATDYVTRCAEAQDVKDCTIDTAVHFIF